MYNGIGLQTPRGSGSNGYIQTNKFFIKPKSGKVSLDHNNVFGAGEGTAGLSKKPNTDILEHDKKRQIEVKLLLLEESLIDQGCSQSHIDKKLAETRLSFQASLAAAPVTTDSSGKKFSETQTHQIAARKEKKLETLRAALGISAGEDDNGQDKFLLEENNPDEKPRVRRPFLDREIRTRHEDEEALREEEHSKMGKTITPRKRDISDRKNRDEFHTGHEKKKSRNPKSKESDDSTDSSGSSRHTKKPKKNKKTNENSRYYDEEDNDSDSTISGKNRRRMKQNNSSQVSDPSSDSEPYNSRHKHRKYPKKSHKRHRSSDDDTDTSSTDSALSLKTQKHPSHHHHMKKHGIKKPKTGNTKEADSDNVGDTVVKHRRRNTTDNTDGLFSSDYDKRKRGRGSPSEDPDDGVKRWVGKKHRGDDSEDSGGSYFDKRGERKAGRKSGVVRESRRKTGREDEYNDIRIAKGKRRDRDDDDDDEEEGELRKESRSYKKPK